MEKIRWLVTGDIHGDLTRIWNFIEKVNINDENCNIIIAGDAGLCWRNDKKDLELHIKFHETRYKTHIYFIDGNHENFKILKSLPVDKTGIAHLSKHIHYIPRGSRMILDFGDYTKTLLAIGGADSIDKYRRTPGLNWWKDEQITKEDIKDITGYFDYVISHCCPTSIFKKNKIYLCTLSNIIDDSNPEYHISEEMLEKLKQNIIFDKWFFGHYHVDRQINDNFTCLFNNFIELE